MCCSSLFQSRISRLEIQCATTGKGCLVLQVLMAIYPKFHPHSSKGHILYMYSVGD